MKAIAVAVLLVLFAVTNTSAAERFPWHFGMSPDEVSAITDYGPYRKFSSGDLETNKGMFDGQEENFQFYFDDAKKLRRIAIHFYEGEDLKEAGRRYMALGSTLAAMFGVMKTFDNSGIDHDGPNDGFLPNALRQVESGGITQMAPGHQPYDAFVFAELQRLNIDNKDYFFVILNFNRLGE